MRIPIRFQVVSVIRRTLSTSSDWKFTRPSSDSGLHGSYQRPSQFSRNNHRSRFERDKYGYEKSTLIKKVPSYGSYEGDHIYGITPVKLALKAKRRRISELLVQDDLNLENKKDSNGATDIIVMAEQQCIPTQRLSKHDLNMICDNRPHQGFILRAEPLDFVKLKFLEPTDSKKVVLALDEVWDPQNVGALLRSSYFLGVDKVVVSAKNSAPLSPVVSKASSGSLELMDIYSTENMMKFLDDCKSNGWHVVGTGLTESAVPLESVTIKKPTILILGNEGHGLRTNIVRRCHQVVKIAKDINKDDGDGVDSLNVSVTGGILLHHLLKSTNMSLRE